MPMPARLITALGETLTVAEWAKRTGIHAKTITTRIDRLGHTPEQALSKKTDQRLGRRKKPANMPKPCPVAKEHKSGHAVVRWYSGGNEHIKYLGPWGSEEAVAAYKRFAAEWLSGSAPETTPGKKASIGHLVARFLTERVEKHYVKDGRATSEQYVYRAALTVLTELYGDQPVAEANGDWIEAIQTALTKKGLKRRSINHYVANIRRCFKWGRFKGLVKRKVLRQLKGVEALQAGRSPAVDNPKKRSVPKEDIKATFPHLHADPERRRVLTAMIRFQLRSGLRPGELCAMKPGAIDRRGKVWDCRVTDKMLHLQEQRDEVVRPIGPRAQRILLPFLQDLAPDDFIWTVSAQEGPAHGHRPRSLLSVRRDGLQESRHQGVDPPPAPAQQSERCPEEVRVRRGRCRGDRQTHRR